MAGAGPALAARSSSRVRGETLPSEAKRYTDPTTEFNVIRLSEPAYSTYLTAPWNRAQWGRNGLVVASERGGKLDGWRLDLKSSQWKRMTDAADLVPQSLAMLPDERNFCFIDGAALLLANASNLRERVIYEAETPYSRLTALAIAPDASQAWVVESKPDRHRLRSISLGRGAGEASTLFESDREITSLEPRPGGGLAYVSRDRISFRDRNGAQRGLPVAQGGVGQVYWSQDGESLLYLNIPERTGELHAIREYTLGGGKDALVAKTTQYVRYAPNGDRTVFVGASGSKASPYVLLLIRSVRRELTLCEHRARDYSSLSVTFAENSQRVIFQSDMHGKPALYMLDVERFVEETES